MLLVNIGIMLSIYAGIRVFKRSSDKRFNKIVRRALKDMPSSKVDDSQSFKDVKKDMTDHEIEKKHDHYVKTSAIAAGLTVGSYFYPPLTILSIGFIGYSVFPIMRQTENSLLKERRLKNDSLNSIISLLTFGLGLHFICSLQILSYHYGRKMVAKSQNISTEMLTNVFEQQPSRVWILKDLMEIEIPLETLQVDDIVIVRAGEVVPVDGMITKGMAMVDQQALTGESVPAEKGMGDKVFAATILVSGQLFIKVEKTGVETTVAKLSELLNNTVEFKTNLQLKGEKWADKVTAPLLGGSVLFSPFLGISSATAILLSAPTNTVTILPSLQTFNHLTLLSNKGILIKDGRVLEELDRIDTILFDKTGTLTHEQLEVGNIVLCGKEGENDILMYAASAEHRLTHPIARAILQKAQERHLSLLKMEEATYKIGYGITVTLKNQVIKVGSARFMVMEGITLPPEIESVKARSYEEGYSLIMVAVDHQLKGAIEIRPQIRPEVKKIIRRLRQRGIQHISIVSGDHKQPTKKLAQELGMDNYYYEVLPHNKAELVEELQKEGHRVCFVGDGINDAIAMKGANVSISLRGASSIATDMAQVVLMDGTLSHLCDVFDISKELNAGLRHSLLFWAGFGVANITMIAFLHFGIVRATLFYGTALGLSIVHAMQPLRQLKDEKLKTISGSDK